MALRTGGTGVGATRPLTPVPTLKLNVPELQEALREQLGFRGELPEFEISPQIQLTFDVVQDNPEVLDNIEFRLGRIYEILVQMYNSIGGFGRPTSTNSLKGILSYLYNVDDDNVPTSWKTDEVSLDEETPRSGPDSGPGETSGSEGGRKPRSRRKDRPGDDSRDSAGD